MPRDKNSIDLQIGDQILISATVRGMSDGGQAVNIQADTDVEIAPGFKTGIGLNSRQVEKVMPVVVPMVKPTIPAFTPGVAKPMESVVTFPPVMTPSVPKEPVKEPIKEPVKPEV